MSNNSTWNRPIGGTAGNHGRGHAQPSRRRVVLPLLIVLFVLLAGGTWWLLSRSDGEKAPAPVGGHEKSRTIAAVTNVPQASARSAPATVAVQKQDSPEARLKRIRDKYGDNIPDNLKAVVYFLEHPPRRTFKSQGTHQYFRHSSERQIAGVVFTEPGTYFVMKPEVGESFDRDFASALVDKIDISEDDPEDVRMAKEQMTEIKREIAEKCGTEGKKPSEVMNEHAAAMYELGQYQRNLEEELDRIHADPELSDDEVEDFCRAANKLLESKGLPKMTMPNLARRSIQLMHAQRRAERRKKGKSK